MFQIQNFIFYQVKHYLILINKQSKVVFIELFWYAQGFLQSNQFFHYQFPHLRKTNLHQLHRLFQPKGFHHN